MTPKMREAWDHMNAVLDAKHAGAATDEEYRAAWDVITEIAAAESTPESRAEAAAFHQRVLDDLAILAEWRAQEAEP